MLSDQAFFFFFFVVRLKLRTLHLPGRCFVVELNPWTRSGSFQSQRLDAFIQQNGG